MDNHSLRCVLRIGMKSSVASRRLIWPSLRKITKSSIRALEQRHLPCGLLLYVMYYNTMGEYGSYAGMLPGINLHKEALDHQVSIRFQTTFLPAPSQTLPTIEFATEVYNYQTHSAENPKNLIFLATTQGLAVQQDGPNRTKLFHHTVLPPASFGSCKPVRDCHWLEAERTQHGVGGPQYETEAQKLQAAARGKAAASVIGPRSLGDRFNVLMTIQVPLKQQQPSIVAATSALPVFGSSPFGGTSFSTATASPFGAGAPAPGGLYGYPTPASGGLFGSPAPSPAFGSPASAPTTCFRGGALVGTQVGVSNAARVSKGSVYDTTWKGLSATAYERDPQQRITVTIVLYHIVAGGVPKESDVVAAIDDLERLFSACHAQQRAETSVFNDPGNTFAFGPPYTTPSPTQQPVVNSTVFPEPVAPKPSFGTPICGAPMSDIPDHILAKASPLPLSEESVNHLCYLGNQLLDNPGSDLKQLYESFCYFRLAKDVSVRLRAVQDSTNLYNMACACSRMSTKDSSSSFVIVPAWARDAVMIRNKALSWLLAAVGAGWNNDSHMKVDPDLEPVCVHHAAAFAAIVNLVIQVKQGF